MTLIDRLLPIFSPNRVRYRCYPTQCDRGAYENAVALYVDQVRKLPEVVGIGRYGNVSIPGISDIDLVVVTEEDISSSSASQLSIANLPDFERNLFMHEASVMPIGGLGHLSEHLDVSIVETVWGAVPPVPSLPDEDRQWQEIAILVEWLGCFCRFFGEISTSRVANVRWALPVLHSLRYTAQIARKYVSNAPQEWEAYSATVADLRASWFDISTDDERAERLSVSLAEGWMITTDICCRVERWIEAEGLLPSLSSERGWRIYTYEPARFAMVLDSSTPEEMIERLLKIAGIDESAQPAGLKIISRLAPSWCLLPKSHDAFAMAAAASAPTVDKHIAGQWFGGQRIQPMKPATPFERYLCGRFKRLEAQARFLETNVVGFGAVCSDLVYAPPAPEESSDSWRRRLLLAAQKGWGQTRAKACASGVRCVGA